MTSSRLAVSIAFVGVLGLMLLYVWNPAEISYFPRCPFFALTGYKCPGCGTLRGIHALLHFRVMDALRFNPFMIISIPLVLAMLVWSKFRFSVLMARVVLIATLLWWMVRNI